MTGKINSNIWKPRNKRNYIEEDWIELLTYILDVEILWIMSDLIQ